VFADGATSGEEKRIGVERFGDVGVFFDGESSNTISIFIPSRQW